MAQLTNRPFCFLSILHFLEFHTDCANLPPDKSSFGAFGAHPSVFRIFLQHSYPLKTPFGVSEVLIAQKLSSFKN